jgi:hypothetical protein
MRLGASLSLFALLAIVDLSDDHPVAAIASQIAGFRFDLIHTATTTTP